MQRRRSVRFGFIDPRPSSRPAPSRQRRVPRSLLALALVLVVTAASVGCSGLGSSDADVVLRLEAEDRPALQRTRQEVLASAGTWGGTRVGEETTEPDETAVVFSLPGQNLDMAIGALNALDAETVETRIDVDPEQVDRTTAPPEGEEPAEVEPVRLRVEVVEAPPAPAGSLGRMVLAIFSVIGMVATVGWVLKLWRRRGEALERRAPRVRNIDRVDLREDPPTQETPRVPPGWN